MPILLFAIFFFHKENDTEIDFFLDWSLCSGAGGQFAPEKMVTLERNGVVSLTGFCSTVAFIKSFDKSILTWLSWLNK